MTFHSDTTEDFWPLIEGYLPANFRDEAVRVGLIKIHSAQLKTKVRDISQVLRLVCMMVGNGFSLRTATAINAAAGHLSMSQVALHKWMRKLGDFFAWLLAEVSKCETSFHPQRWGQYDVIATDATTVQRPGATETTARVHIALRLSTLRPLEYKVTSEKGGEHLGGFECMGPDQLWIGDRGYANPPCIARANSVGAAVLIRYNLSSMPLYASATSESCIDVVSLLQSRARVGQVNTATVWVKPKFGEPIRGHLHFRKMGKKKTEVAQQKLLRERKKAGEPRPSDAVLKFAGFHVVFTTAPVNRLSGADCLELYRLRWQIELLNKREKSIAGLDELPNFRPDTIDSWICAKLLLTQITMKIAESSLEQRTNKKTSTEPNRKKKKEQCCRPRQVVDEVWRVFVLVWSVLRSALVPINLLNLKNMLGKFTKQLSRTIDSLRRPKQISRFLDALSTG